MDIELPEIRGIEATQIIRRYESEYNSIHTIIVALSVNASKGKFSLKLDGEESCFDASCIQNN